MEEEGGEWSGKQRRKMPPRKARVKSFVQLEKGGVASPPPSLEAIEGPAEVAVVVSSASSRPVGRSSAAAVARRVPPITSSSPSTPLLMHDQWPLYADYPVDFLVAADIIIGSLLEIPADRLSTSVPQLFVSAGTFVVDLSGFGNRHEIAVDGLGSWGKPQGSVRFYRYVDGQPQRVEAGEQFDIKVLCNRYQHPGTDAQRGRFFRKIYTATSASMGFGPLPLAVITYEWRGDPHEVEVVEQQTKAACRPYGGRSWEVKEVPAELVDSDWNGSPIYATVAVDFETVAKLILGAVAVPNDRVCNRVPQGYRLNGTFVVDLRDFVTENELRKDGNGFWSKPSGCSRYYKIEHETFDAVRLDRGHQLPPSADYDIQILSKRYENEHPQTYSRFVRKIYIAKGRNSKHLQSCCNLAVITYFWKGDPIDFDVELPRRASILKKRLLSSHSIGPGGMAAGIKVRRLDGGGMERSEGGGATPIFEDEMESPGANVTLDSGPTTTATIPAAGRRHYPGGAAHSTARKSMPSSDGMGNSYAKMTPLSGLVLSHTDHLKRLTLAKELENQQRFSALLERAELFLDRFEQAGAAIGLAEDSQHFIGDDGIWEGGAQQHLVHDAVIVQDDGTGQYISADGQTVTVVPAGYTVQNVEY